MKTETLKGFGLNDEQVKQVMAEYGNEVNTLKQEKDTAEQERDSLQQQFDEVNSQLADAQKDAKKGSELQGQLKDLQDKFDESKANAEQQLQATKKDYEISNALRQAGAKNEKAVMALLDTDSIAFNNKGKLTGLSDQLDTIKKDNDFLFEAENTETKTPIITPTGNPNPTGAPAGKELADYSYQELSALKADNPTQYQELVGGSN
ncbi:phage scaffolding protein [Weissella bombi]|uniref:Phage minor structural protein GP20 n=2 Tax=Weissella bombi TaxID=1505725 RepID=A0A1C4C7E8_9LACO|nr:phage scaffolding protein [Weissella bombi]SCC15050.1 Phage minor structural protein GP20 [Weissella bombi]